MSLFGKLFEYEYEKMRDEIISTWNRCSICNNEIPPCQNAEFNGKCEDCFYDSRR